MPRYVGVPRPLLLSCPKFPSGSLVKAHMLSERKKRDRAKRGRLKDDASGTRRSAGAPPQRQHEVQHGATLNVVVFGRLVIVHGLACKNQALHAWAGLMVGLRREGALCANMH